eukprot:CAMPEP_0119353958 /NCGR_PEP_ID=MMETSP1334-20130426/3044_1 /TAXON_ID=127549 /ORGANISM="Calcidiscus leptoporus, Strain RCC1130" /LENGTH=283 /DNA_ID=CAMNT_0007367383 /DNA_START=159 /DNA_END=1010 /DNA_ORIENTATION=+
MVFARSLRASEQWSFLPILNITKGLPDVYYTSPESSVFRAVVDMVKLRSGSLIVGDGNKAQGILTERDILDKLPFEAGAARSLRVTALMTPSDSLVSAPPSFTLDQCVHEMQSGGFRHLPIMQGGAVKAVISIRDIAQHVASALSKAPLSEPTTVEELMAAKEGGFGTGVSSSASVGDAVKLMRDTRSGAALVSDGDSFGIMTERDFLTKVAVYDEADPNSIPISSIMTRSGSVKSVPPTGRVADCLSLMVAGGFRHLPVVQKSKLVGVISMQDILQHFLGSK